MSIRAKMVYEVGDYVFEKYPKGNTINVYTDDNNVDCFTNYNIGDDFDKFEKACDDYVLDGVEVFHSLLSGDVLVLYNDVQLFSFDGGEVDDVILHDDDKLLEYVKTTYKEQLMDMLLL